MKTLFTLFVLLPNIRLQGQDLRNSEWIQIKASRKDGSKIIDHSYSDKRVIKYYFEDDSVSTALGIEYSFKRKFTINNNVLSIGQVSKYHIDTLTNIVLALTEIPSQELTDDKINSFIFVNSKYIFEYLTQIGQVKTIGDSLIQCTRLFSPTCKRSVAELLSKEFIPALINGTLTGSIMLLSGGNIKSVLFDDSDKFRKKDIEKFISIMKSTQGSWVMPVTTKPFEYKIDFIYETSYSHRFRTRYTSLFLGTKDTISSNEKAFTLQEKSDAGKHFNKGIDLLNSEKFEKAIIEFDKCIKIDSIYLDAYYNKAYSYFKLGNKNLACDIWYQLKEMGQKQGELMYNENCK